MLAFKLHFSGQVARVATNETVEECVMKLRILAALAAPAAALGLAACTVEKDDEGPGVDVEPADVRVDWDTTQVKTPDIDVVPRDTSGMDTTARDTPRR
jgi:hypothetical protein